MTLQRYMATLLQASILMMLSYYKIYWAVVGLVYFGVRQGLARLEAE